MTFVLKQLGSEYAGRYTKGFMVYIPDPYMAPVLDSAGNITKWKKMEVPAGLSKRDQKILQKVRSRAHYLDKGFGCGPFRFGYTGIIGVIPVVGDAANALLNYSLILRVARQADLPPWLVAKMASNNVFSFGVGMVPFAGDIIMAAYKANSRNAHLLAEYLQRRGELMLQDPDRYAVLLEAAEAYNKIPKSKRKNDNAEPMKDELKHVRELKPGSGMKRKELERFKKEQQEFMKAQAHAQAAAGATGQSTQVADARLSRNDSAAYQRKNSYY